jgi:hypothetical protein
LLEEACCSVAQYHQEWLDFFGSEEVILPKYQANQQLQRFQEETTQRRLTAAGIDSTQSLAELEVHKTQTHKPKKTSTASKDFQRK